MLAHMRAGAAVRGATLYRCVRPLLRRRALLSRHARHRRSLRRRRDVAADRIVVEDRRHAAGQRMGRFGGSFQTHHRGFRHFDRRPPGRKSAAPAGRPWRVSTTSRPRRNISCSKTARTNWRCWSAWSMDWGSTGAINSGIATPYSVLTPTFYFGKGFGDLPDSAGWLRAFAVTGQIGYQVPSRSFDVVDGSFIPQVLAWGGSIQYSMPYLKSEIQDLQLPDFINHLIPIVEFQMSTPGRQQFRQQLRHHRHHQSGRDLGRQLFPGRTRGPGAGQCPERARHRRARAIASLSRRHVPEDDRPAAHRRHIDARRNRSSSEVSPCENFSSSYRCSSPLSRPSRRAPMLSSITPARWSAARCPRRRTRSC